VGTDRCPPQQSAFCVAEPLMLIGVHVFDICVCNTSGIWLRNVRMVAVAIFKNCHVYALLGMDDYKIDC
jgi:hypothetical protein